MFIGHYATGLAVKKLIPETSLGTAIIASQLPDIIFPVLLLLGIEKAELQPGITKLTPVNFSYYPFSHSLLFSILLAIAFGVVYYSVKKNKKAAIVLSLLVIGHWILDLITHRADLPLTPWDNNYFGLGLWNSVAGSVIVEFVLFFAGAFLYVKNTTPVNWKGIWGIQLFITLLGCTYITSLLGPPPPAINVMAYSGLAQWLFIYWAFRIDKNRKQLLINEPVEAIS